MSNSCGWRLLTLPSHDQDLATVNIGYKVTYGDLNQIVSLYMDRRGELGH